MKVETSVEIAYPAAEVWSLAGSYGALPVISSGAASSQLEDGGRVRVLVNRDGSVLWERLLEFNEAERTLCYEIIDSKAFHGAYGPGYRGRVRVREASESISVFHYEADFVPTDGTTEEEARNSVVGFANDCADGIRRALGRRRDT